MLLKRGHAVIQLPEQTLQPCRQGTFMRLVGSQARDRCVGLGIQAVFPIISLCVCNASLWVFAWFYLSELCQPVAVH